MRGLLRKTWRILRYPVYALSGIVLALFIFLFVGFSSPRNDIEWGVNFSSKHTRSLGLDPRETYLAIMDDLGAKLIKIAVHWDGLEPERGKYDWSETDWQISEAGKRGVKIVPIIGIKSSRWPECHIPEWARGLDRPEQEALVMKELEAFVTRYRNNPAILMWQVENEPFFTFGDCPWENGPFLKKEIALVHKLDPSRKVMVTDSGEFSTWFPAANLADVVGSTMYRIVWNSEFKMYIKYPFPPVYYSRRAWLVKQFTGKEIINSELQAEPWGPYLYYDMPLEEQMQSVSPAALKKNIDYARRTHLNPAYFWGTEWWYWMKVKHNDPAYWDIGKEAFKEA